jgi:hypothetical protein
MTVKELEEEVKALKQNIVDLNTRIDLLINKPKETDNKEPISEKPKTLYDFYQLYFAVILGATGSLLINAYVANSKNWVLLFITIGYIAVGSLGAVCLIHFFVYRLPKRKRGKMDEPKEKSESK